MHSHEGLQEAFLLSAPVIVHDPADEPADEQQVVGDQRTKHYYPSDCAERDSVPPGSRTIFKTKELAEKAGYTLAKDCQ